MRGVSGLATSYQIKITGIRLRYNFLSERAYIIGDNPEKV